MCSALCPAISGTEMYPLTIKVSLVGGDENLDTQDNEGLKESRQSSAELWRNAYRSAIVL